MAGLSRTRSVVDETASLKDLRARCEPCTNATEVAKKHGISEQTVYAWRKRFGALEPADVKRLRGLEAENARLKKLLAERSRRMTDLSDSVGLGGNVILRNLIGGRRVGVISA